jgi:hypothetical protein
MKAAFIFRLVGLAAVLAGFVCGPAVAQNDAKSGRKPSDRQALAVDR